MKPSRVIGLAVISAVMSIFVASVFSHLALASPAPVGPMPTLNRPAVILGTYRIWDVKDEEGRSKCRSLPEGKRPHRDCEDRVWIVRSADELVLFEASSDTRWLDVFLFMSPSADGDCRQIIRLADARRDLFGSDVCRAKKTRETSTNEVFVAKKLRVSPNEDETSNAEALSKVLLVTNTENTIYLPRSQTVPGNVTIRHKFTGGGLMGLIPLGTMEEMYQLIRVGE